MSRRFLKISRTEEETEIILTSPWVQKFTGGLLLVLGTLFGSFVLIMYLEAAAQLRNAADLLAWLLGVVICVFLAGIVLRFAGRMIYDQHRLTIDSETIQYEHNGYFGKRKKVYFRSEFHRLERNFIVESKYHQEYPTLELQLDRDTIRLKCANEQEQAEVENLLREIFKDQDLTPKEVVEPDETETPRGFHVQIRREGETLVLDQPPEKGNEALVFFLVIYGACYLFMLAGWIAGEFPKNPRPNPWIDFLVGLVPLAVLLGLFLLLCLREFYGHCVYTFERRTLSVDFRCLGFRRKWVYDYADIRSVETACAQSKRGGRIARCVKIKVPWKTFRIKVASEEEQQYLCALIRQTLTAT